MWFTKQLVVLNVACYESLAIRISVITLLAINSRIGTFLSEWPHSQMFAIIAPAKVQYYSHSLKFGNFSVFEDTSFDMNTKKHFCTRHIWHLL